LLSISIFDSLSHQGGQGGLYALSVIRRLKMAEINIVKTDSRGRVTLPAPFRSEPLFEYVIEGDQITLYPVRTVRKYPDMSDLPAEKLPAGWVKQEEEVNKDTRKGISARTPTEALKAMKE